MEFLFSTRCVTHLYCNKATQQISTGSLLVDAMARSESDRIIDPEWINYLETIHHETGDPFGVEETRLDNAINK